MGKPPFKYKPNKPKASEPQIQLGGSDEVSAIYSDIFVVVNEGDTGLGSIYFYQRRLADRSVVLGRTETSGTLATTAKCIGRVLLSHPGIEKLLEALAENRGFTLTRKSPSGEEKK